MSGLTTKDAIEMEGIKPLLARLESLRKNAGKKHLRRAVAKANSIVNKGLKARVPRGTGLLKKAVGQRVVVYRGSGVVVGIVGARVEFRQTRDGRVINPVKYAHIADRGRRAVTPRRKKVMSAGPGKVIGTKAKAYRGRNFMKRTADEEREAIRRAIVDTLMDGIEKETRK